MKKSTARRKKSRKKEERKMEMESKREKRGEGRIGKGEEVKKEERETRRGSRTQSKNFTEFLKTNKQTNFVSVSQDYPPLNNLVSFFFFFYTYTNNKGIFN